MKARWVSVAFGGWLIACNPPPEPSQAPASPVARSAHDEPGVADAVASSRTLYVPAYSHIFASAGKRIMLSITLGVRNIDPAAGVVLRYVDYFDTPGHRVRRYLDTPRNLAPLETVEFFVDVFDDRGGSGANFLVGFEAPEGAQTPLAEAVMLGHSGAGSIAFTSRGVLLERAPQTAAKNQESDAAAAP